MNLTKASILFYLIALYFSGGNLYANSIDSLNAALQNSSSIEKFNTFLEEGNAVYLNDSKYSKECCEEAKRIASSINDSVNVARAKYCIARAVLINGDVERSLNMLNECASFFERNNLKIEMGDALSLKALTLRRINESEEGTKTLKQAIKIFEEEDDKLRLMKCLINISLDYVDMDEFAYAFDYLARAEQLNKEVKDTINEFYISLNLGNLYAETNNPTKALKYYEHSFQIAVNQKMTDALVTNLIEIGSVYLNIDRPDMALQKFIAALDKANEFNLPHEKMDALQNLNNVYRQFNDYELALKYYEEFIVLRDSMYSVERLARIDHLEKKLDVEKKESQLALNQLEIEHQNTQITKQTNQKYLFAGALSIVFVVMLFVYKSLKDKKKANKIIVAQKIEVERKKDEVEEKNKEILDSINYAKRIQQALLKSEEKITEVLPPHFIYFEPKDIVSGDFYWAFEKQIANDKYIYLAAADCTGHGVPGGFMSMLSIAYLNEIAGQDKYLEPSEILNQLREKVIKELGQTGKIGETKDGLDISLCSIKESKDGKVNIEWAGANNPLWIISESEIANLTVDIRDNELNLSEIKANKQPIGFYSDIEPYTNHKFTLSKGDSLIMFSDGFPDQFGGVKGKKFKYKPFKKLLLSLNREPLDKQKEKLSIAFNEWKGSLEQIDDVCVIGIKV